MPTLWRAFGKICRVRSISDAETGDPPPPIVLMLDRSYLSASGKLTMRCSSVSVNDQPVHCSRSMMRIATAGSKRPMSHTLLSPVASIITAALCSPDTWNSGLDTSWQVGSGGGSSGPGGRAQHHRLGAVVEVDHQERRDVAVRVDRALGPPVVPDV